MNKVASTGSQQAAHVLQLRLRVNDALAYVVEEQEPAALYGPVRYVLAGQGKRLRPVLVMLAAEAYDTDFERMLPAALAVEVFHNFTLVHDDVMDHAESRRGRPTVHVKWDESTALLCGDYLMALAYDLLSQTRTSRLDRVLSCFHRMVGRLCEGQALDKAFETRRDVSVADYLHMVDRKTAALVEAALEIGGLVGGADAKELAAFRTVGRQMGRAYQIQDDLLDLVADHDRWGKQVGGDLVEGKKTFLLLRALERADEAEHNWFLRIIEQDGLSEEKVPEARSRMEQLGVLAEAREAVARHSAAARAELDQLPPGPAVDTLRWLIEQMEARLH